MTDLLTLPVTVKTAANSVGALGRQVQTALSSPAVTPDILARAKTDLDALIERATALRDRLA